MRLFKLFITCIDFHYEESAEAVLQVTVDL